MNILLLNKLARMRRFKEAVYFGREVEKDFFVISIFKVYKKVGTAFKLIIKRNEYVKLIHVTISNRVLILRRTIKSRITVHYWSVVHFYYLLILHFYFSFPFSSRHQNIS